MPTRAGFVRISAACAFIALALAPSFASAQGATPPPPEPAPAAREPAAEPAAPVDPAVQRAEELFLDGRKELEQSHFDVACQRFTESMSAHPSIAAQLNLGLCHENAGRFATAQRAYRHAQDMALRANDAERAAAASEAATALVPRVGRVALSFARRPGRVELWIDGKRVDAIELAQPVAIDPGDRVIEVRAAGYRAWSTHAIGVNGTSAAVAVPELTATKGEVDPRDLTDGGDAAPGELSAAAKGAPHSDWRPGMRTAGFVALGVGGAGIVVGAVFGGLALSAKGDMKDKCAADGDGNDQLCSSDVGQRARQMAESRAGASTLAFALGGSVAALGGLALIMARPAAPAAPATAITIAPTLGGAMISGTF